MHSIMSLPFAVMNYLLLTSGAFADIDDVNFRGYLDSAAKTRFPRRIRFKDNFAPGFGKRFSPMLGGGWKKFRQLQQNQQQLGEESFPTNDMDTPYTVNQRVNEELTNEINDLMRHRYFMTPVPKTNEEVDRIYDALRNEKDPFDNDSNENSIGQDWNVDNLDTDTAKSPMALKSMIMNKMIRNLLQNKESRQ
ncbi:hypothetical protein MAR_034995 [Mya arenaria]|uniref:Uncharacterized protein n=1 Tax=Mya arenaria TaxID=6604 RepID=A0ABY7ENF1_MYAAR|nr:uncharacterized protein LOC128241764 [Mya arenaria]WAR09919.1 hypothetical protein MAR_034995 [Mya arenaria]